MLNFPVLCSVQEKKIFPDVYSQHLYCAFIYNQVKRQPCSNHSRYLRCLPLMSVTRKLRMLCLTPWLPEPLLSWKQVSATFLLLIHSGY